jgi:hypothetical protein
MIERFRCDLWNAIRRGGIQKHAQQEISSLSRGYKYLEVEMIMIKLTESAVAWVIGRGYRGCEDPAESLPLQALKELH